MRSDFNHQERDIFYESGRDLPKKAVSECQTDRQKQRCVCCVCVCVFSLSRFCLTSFPVHGPAERLVLRADAVPVDRLLLRHSGDSRHGRAWHRQGDVRIHFPAARLVLDPSVLLLSGTNAAAAKDLRPNSFRAEL